MSLSLTLMMSLSLDVSTGIGGAFGSGGVSIPTLGRYPKLAFFAPIPIGFFSRSCASVLGMNAVSSP